MPSRHMLLVCVAVALVVPAVLGQLEPWSVPVSLGPLGGSAISVVVDPLDPVVILVIQGAKGLFRSTDAGATFEPFGTGLSPDVRDLEHIPGEAHGLYALDGKQVFRSTDFGATWVPLPLLAAEPLKALALPASGNSLLALDAFNIYLSTDGGLNWATTAALVPYAGEVFDSIAFSADGALAFVGTFHGVLRSSDGGASFVPAGGAFDDWVQCITVSPSDPQTVLLGTPFTGLYRSLDGGANFVSIGSALTTGNAEFFAWEPDGSHLWYAMLDGLVQSTDGGDTWADGTAGWPTNTPIPAAMALPSSGPRYFGCEGGGLNDQSGGGLYRMPAGTPTAWEHIGFLNALINAVAIASPGGLRVLGIGSGVYAGAPGVAPTPTAWHADIGTDTRALAIDPADPTRWLTGGVGAFFDNAQIVVETSAGQAFAKTWEQSGAGVVQDIAFDPFDSQRVIAGIFPGSFGNESLIRSVDGGASWVDVPGTKGWATRVVAWDPHMPGRVVQLSDNNQWSQSTNGGLTWQPLQPALPATGPAVLLAFDPFTPGVVFRGDAGSGLWRSDDGGANWLSLGVDLQVDSDLELHPQQPGLLWVSDASGHVLVSGDGGDSFEVALDIPLGSNGSALALDTSNGTLLVGTTSASTWELPGASPLVVLGEGTPGTGGLLPRCTLAGGLPQLGNPDFGIAGADFVGGALVYLAIGLADAPVAKFGGTFYVGGAVLWLIIPAGGTPGAAGAGAFTATLPLPNDPLLANLELVVQLAAKDPGVPHPSHVVLSNALKVTLLP